ncbi:mannitol dehydrogenase family protein [Paraburkholderia rhynchosiae]|uniref:Altronate oxidoreductase n=1 Tax=Paraburkholderia rhynchosiae TaxID=487049 RepID=A0A2N7W6U9_9BURK|nr:D-mannonate oxidoreductase [Paraburkholderia rhynchosiae]PMS25131.1 D-mannonate oxidoreductase [Paraburkholderia rhynchosiae]CAB3714883.1 Altronate oxidoreductase [Paraburkholderia rhynchosiae]
MTNTPSPILQFGTSRFLQAHVDLFVCEAARRNPDDALGKIAMVQTTASAQSRARIDAIRSNAQYPVRIRGLHRNQTVDLTIECDSVAEALHAHDDWPALLERICDEVRVIVSNTADNGYALFPDDTVSMLDGRLAPRSFAAKLAVLLHERYRAGGKAITLLPCELVSRNGDVLRDLVLSVARGWQMEPGFLRYLANDCIWVNSLVDRIVSEAIEPIGAVAEPYALWAIERQEGMVLPCRHESIVITDDLAHYERLKLFLLNLGHTMLAQCWLDSRGDPAATVLDGMRNESWRATLESTWKDEVLPVFEAQGQCEIATRYLDDVRDRFNNPFLAHRLADIAGNHQQKKQRRFKPVVELARELGVRVDQKRLEAALAGT